MALGNRYFEVYFNVCMLTSFSQAYPTSATTLHFEFYAEQKEEKVVRKGTVSVSYKKNESYL